MQRKVRHRFEAGKINQTRNADFAVKLIGLTQNISQTLISPCRASCSKSGNRKGALATLLPLR
ncbi:hypothetical protein COO91_08751 [Nostoc flagelliforme CCNUN1]|uniref:Uncharacterized protein n=1 Tax=Nostoc flagelliforme CCNUN1 TaxID=2038116 RepID=A0A2K8T4M3_9NOSO|nr:hypothetical protein COO91_08751 [Nostoc flagelliforme CCNUN1]